jgi:hypothetical protein
MGVQVLDYELELVEQRLTKDDVFWPHVVLTV